MCNAELHSEELIVLKNLINSLKFVLYYKQNLGTNPNQYEGSETGQVQ